MQALRHSGHVQLLDVTHQSARAGTLDVFAMAGIADPGGHRVPLAGEKARQLRRYPTVPAYDGDRCHVAVLFFVVKQFAA
jgi:hypothetical protein